MLTDTDLPRLPTQDVQLLNRAKAANRDNQVGREFAAGQRG